MKRTLKILSIYFITFVCLATLGLGIFYFVNFSAIDFDSSRWKLAEGKESQDRVRMVDHLLEKFPLIGKDMAYVERMLGLPRTKYPGYQAQCHLLYWLGTERSLFPVDSEWLCLEFKAGVVSRVEIITD